MALSVDVLTGRPSSSSSTSSSSRTSARSKYPRPEDGDIYFYGFTAINDKTVLSTDYLPHTDAARRSVRSLISKEKRLVVITEP